MANPYHDENGEFCSPEEAAARKQKVEGTAKKRVKKKEKPKVTITVKEGSGGLSALAAALKDLNSSIQLGHLKDPAEIEENIEKLWSKRVISHVDRLYGKSSNTWSKKYIFHPKSNPNVNLNMFTCIFGKHRYPDNHAQMVDAPTFDKLKSNTEKFTQVYRGFSSVGEKRTNILKSYCTADIDNLDIYGNGVYGTNVYTSTTYSYSLDYANGEPSKVLHCLVDRDAYYADSDYLELKRDRYFDYDYRDKKFNDNAQRVVDKVKNHLINNNIEEERANDIATDFMKSILEDVSLYAILMGYDYQTSASGQQRNILNLKKRIIRK